jgi:hypothetical protein
LSANIIFLLSNFNCSKTETLIYTLEKTSP